MANKPAVAEVWMRSESSGTATPELRRRSARTWTWSSSVRRSTGCPCASTISPQMWTASGSPNCDEKNRNNYGVFEEREKGFELSQGLEILQRVRRVVRQVRETIQVPSLPCRLVPP